MDAYITNFTFSKLCRNLNIKTEVDLETFIYHIYDDASLFYFFNKLELKYLFNYKNILENDENYLVQYYQHVPKRIDTKSFVFEKPRKLKYHLSNECECMKHDYVDFHIPQDIRDLGDDVVEEYRNWFKEKDYANQYFQGILDIPKVVFDYNMMFPPKYKVTPLNEKYKLVLELSNSNIHEIENSFDYSRFLNNIINIKKRRANKFQCKITRTLSKFDYLIHKSDEEIIFKIVELFSVRFVENYGLENIKELFKYSIKLKKELMRNLIEYFKWTYKNKNVSIDELTLNKFGLECCSKCIVDVPIEIIGFSKN